MSDISQHPGFQAPEPEELAAYFPGYDIECLVASGGMGAVYRAVQRSLDRLVALKILPREFSADAAFCEGFEAEAKAMARLNHPNLIGVYDFGEVDGMLFIIMEYVHGKSLHHSAHGLAIEAREVARLVSEIGLGLAHAHEHGILHRDIKPGNILLDLNARPKVGDFGLARPVERQIQEGEEIYGTPHYTAPEVVDSPSSVGYRADIFSLGVVLHELLTGKLPADDPRAPSEIIGCDPRFDQIVRRATYQDPQFRYASAAELVKDLQAILAGPALAPPKVAKVVVPTAPMNSPRRTTVVYQPQESSGFPTGLVFFVLLILGGGAGYYFWKNSQKQEAPAESKIVAHEPEIPKPVLPKEVKPADPEPDFGKPTQPEEPSSAFGSAEKDSDTPQEEEIGEPKFNVNGFLERGRRGMKQIAKSPLASYQQAMKSNCQSFEGQLATNIRKLSASKREVAMSTLAQDYKQWQADGYRIPTSLSGAYDEVSSVDAIHTPALEKQKKLDEELALRLRSFTPAYIKGVEKQIDSLRTQDDPNAIKLLERELNKVKDDPEYFASIITGNESASQANSDGFIIVPAQN